MAERKEERIVQIEKEDQVRKQIPKVKESANSIIDAHTYWYVAALRNQK